jgi:hypothetical protein
MISPPKVQIHYDDIIIPANNFSEPHSVGSGDLRQMNGYPIPPGEPYHSCILRKGCKPAFLHPERKMQGLIDLTQG